MTLSIQTTSASFPGWRIEDAVRACKNGVSEPLLGVLNTKHMQLCPQSRGVIDESLCDMLLAEYPDIHFRLHANARVMPNMVRWDASCFNDETRHYYERLAEISKRLKAPAYSIHAGNLKNTNMAGMLDNLKRIQDIFGDIPVAVEGLYPNPRSPQLMDTWDSYQAVYDSGAFVALDLSHLKLLPRPEQFKTQWMSWLESKQTLEVHLSDNDGDHDSHGLLVEAPFWWEGLNEAAIGSNTIIFSEGDQVRAARG